MNDELSIFPSEYVTTDQVRMMLAQECIKHYWARLAETTEKYGTWVPTGCTDLQEAADYMQTYPISRLPMERYRIVEWLLM